MALCRVESGGRISLVHNINVDAEFIYFAVKCDIDTLVALSITQDKSLCLHHLVGEELNKLSHISLSAAPSRLLWSGVTLLAMMDSASENESIFAVEVSDTQLTRARPLLIDPNRLIIICWCLIEDKIALFDARSYNLLVYSVPYTGLPVS